MIDRGDKTGPHELGLNFGRRVAPPEPEQHRRKRFPPDRVIECHAADEDPPLGGGGDLREPRSRRRGLSSSRAFMRFRHAATAITGRPGRCVRYPTPRREHGGVAHGYIDDRWPSRRDSLPKRWFQLICFFDRDADCRRPASAAKAGE